MELKDVKHLATLARLDIPEEEQQALLGDLTAILGYIDQVSTVAVSAREAAAGDHHNSAREDAVTNTPSQENTDRLLGQAVGQQDGFVKVKKIL